MFPTHNEGLEHGSGSCLIYDHWQKVSLVIRPARLAGLQQATFRAQACILLSMNRHDRAPASTWVSIDGNGTYLLAELGGGEREGGKITGGGDYRYAR